MPQPPRSSRHHHTCTNQNRVSCGNDLLLIPPQPLVQYCHVQYCLERFILEYFPNHNDAVVSLVCCMCRCRKSSPANLQSTIVGSSDHLRTRFWSSWSGVALLFGSKDIAGRSCTANRKRHLLPGAGNIIFKFSALVCWAGLAIARSLPLSRARSLSWNSTSNSSFYL